MKVLLIKDVKGLGKAGEVKDVKDGYGNNFLIGKGLAKAATDAVLRQYEAAKKKEAETKAYEISQSQKLASELSNVKILIKSKLGANGALFGSVTKDDIANALKEQKGYDVDKKSIECDHIKTTGTYDVSLKLGNSISAKFELVVVGE
ncbi:50S ribosomal protein L9 [Campylobacter iguaniorum]|uniref:Large ribosomal subunit protein bL9 n=1 Tax=Campylobacter iguaniorum TaxID=1244531 RepID=A0A076FFZ6_9BACT|nr:50S ribosomal protein L9 [Campylobacter iguaniorum]AII14744.1 50S ribosomal protein L9 [Campylobacter iguaniorum]ALV24479.1 50S ribosomal protein L9 [Campylobacter iguaniorum]